MIQFRFDEMGMILREAYEEFIETHNNDNASFITLPSYGHYGLFSQLQNKYRGQEVWVSGFDWAAHQPDDMDRTGYYWNYSRPRTKTIDGVEHSEFFGLLRSYDIWSDFFTNVKSSEINIVLPNSSKSNSDREYLLLMPAVIFFAEKNIETLGSAFLHSVVNLATSQGFLNFRLTNRNGGFYNLPPLPTLNSNDVVNEVLSSAILRSVQDKPMVFARFFNEERAKRGISGHLKQKEVQVLLEKFLES